MEGTGDPVPSEVNSADQDAEELLREGMLTDFTPHAAREYIERCRAALAGMTPGDSLLAVKLMTARILASAHGHTAQLDLIAEAASADEVGKMAARLDDEIARAYALVSWGFTRPAPEHAEGRVQAAEEILGIASRRDESSLIPVGYALLLVGLLEMGEIRSLDIELLDRRAAAADLHGTHEADPARWFRCLRSILDGDTESAEQQAEELFARSRHHGTHARALYTTQMGMIRWMQGRIDGAEEGFLAARREYPEQLLWTASLAWLWLLQGRRASGEALLRTLPDLEDIPRDRYWLSTVTVLAEIARVHGSREDAERHRWTLLPFAERLVPVGVGVAFWGTCARSLGLLEERLGLLDAARSHLELAVALSNRLGALAWHAEAQIELAEFAIRHELADVPAYELLAEARATSQARGFAALARRAMHRPRIRVLGGFEVVSLCGTRADWTSRKARELLKMLVAARGVGTSREVFMEVLWPGESPARLSNRFSVAVNVIRRALDPDRLLPTQHHLVTEGDSVRLDTGHLDIDLERFLSLAQRGDDASRRAARALYRGEAFSDEPYTDWAVTVRDHASHLRGALG